MIGQSVRILLPAACLTLAVGCESMQTVHPTLNQEIDRDLLGRFFDPMAQSAAAHDMSVADIHFAPRTSVLNGLGVRRLEQLRPTLVRYGGTVRYETRSTDSDRIDARLASITAYLSESGVDMANVEVTDMISGGRGMSAKEAIAARDNFVKAGYGKGGTGAISK